MSAINPDVYRGYDSDSSDDGDLGDGALGRTWISDITSQQPPLNSLEALPSKATTPEPQTPTVSEIHKSWINSAIDAAQQSLNSWLIGYSDKFEQFKKIKDDDYKTTTTCQYSLTKKMVDMLDFASLTRGPFSLFGVGYSSQTNSYKQFVCEISMSGLVPLNEKLQRAEVVLVMKKIVARARAQGADSRTTANLQQIVGSFTHYSDFNDTENAKVQFRSFLNIASNTKINYYCFFKAKLSFDDLFNQFKNANDFKIMAMASKMPGVAPKDNIPASTAKVIRAMEGFGYTDVKPASAKRRPPIGASV